MRRLATWLLACAALVTGCGEEAPAAPPAAPRVCPVPEGRASMIVSRFTFLRQDPMRATVAGGFNLDGRVSTVGDLMSCRQSDFTSPEGAPGVDNQLARLIPVVDSMTGGALDSTVQTAINNGQLLLAVTIEGMHDRCNDPDVTLVFQRVAGMPFIGSDMRIDPGQTFDLMRDTTPTRVRGRIREAVLTIEPANVPLPIAVLDARFILMFHDTQLRLRLDEKGGAEGMIGGGLSVEDFSATVRTFGIPERIQMSVVTALRLFADLAPDANGRCQRLSGALSVSARPAFINP